MNIFTLAFNIINSISISQITIHKIAKQTTLLLCEAAYFHDGRNLTATGPEPPPSDVASNNGSCQSSQPANHLRAASNRQTGEAGRKCALLWSDSYRTNGSDAIAHRGYRHTVCRSARGRSADNSFDPTMWDFLDIW